eukprot:TRINITY_DN34397_c0_g1_i1.p1 TRINITY_DN34397_c0_g1~~TRINITY_DN34397_c0_g1_i1.p1  ORF type:complete len:690 (+),score=110.16 TRINITY_DN34397_c0_g1_i1:428-2497(+)
MGSKMLLEEEAPPWQDGDAGDPGGSATGFHNTRMSKTASSTAFNGGGGIQEKMGFGDTLNSSAGFLGCSKGFSEEKYQRTFPRVANAEQFSPLELIHQMENARYKCVEGKSTFNKGSVLGNTVVTLGKSALFGELALQNDRPRAASIECVTDCEFLVIPQRKYMKVIKELQEATMVQREAHDLMLKTDFFKNLENGSPGLIAGLAAGSKFQSLPKEQVVFRQGDPAKDCFVMEEGVIGVYIHNPETLSDEYAQVHKPGWTTPRKLHPTDRLITMESFWNASFANEKERQKKYDKRLADKEQRWLTYEGFSSFTQESDLGKCVVKLGKNIVFGELALNNDKPRAASIKCHSACRMLVIKKEVYLGILKEVMERIRYFESHLPGLENLKYRQQHPCHFFVERTFPAGFTFTFEDIIASEPALYLLKSGTIEFRRYRKPFENPAYVLAKKPLLESSWRCTGCARPLTGVAGSKKTRSGRPMRSPDYQEGLPATPGDHIGRQTVWETMRDTGVFCTMQFFPMSCGEPFTVVSTTPVQVYHAGGDGILNIPLDVMKPLRKTLINEFKDRMRDLPMHQHFPQDQTELFRETFGSLSEFPTPVSSKSVPHDNAAPKELQEVGKSAAAKPTLPSLSRSNNAMDKINRRKQAMQVGQSENTAKPPQNTNTFNASFLRAKQRKQRDDQDAAMGHILRPT